MPLVNLTRATLRIAEFGFFGVVVYLSLIHIYRLLIALGLSDYFRLEFRVNEWSFFQ